MTIAVDFDGTIVEHRYPQIGEEIPFATATLKMLINERHRLILWSVREGKLLEGGLPDWGSIYRMVHDGLTYEELFRENSEPVRQKKKGFWARLKK